MTRLILIFTVALFTTNCACSSERGKKKDTEETKVSISQEDSTKSLVGGYTAQKKLIKSDTLVFQEAIKLYKTTNKYSPLSVSKQVVAGTNYLFVCDVLSKDGSKSKEEVLIFKPLPHTKKLANVVKTTTIK